MNAYSKDLRTRVLAAVDRGVSRAEIVEAFGVSLATVRRWLKRRRETGEVSPRPSPGRTPSICGTAEERRALWRQLEANPEAALERHCELWERARGVAVSASTMSRAVRRLGWTYKQRRWEPPSATKKREPLGAGV
ncbi:MAG: helix-turn-helix domain-containing protein [Actinomycetota bacterium]|nr:helix-turn-helix domain-containing protein [Actinomycetota bacterium]